MGGDGGLGTNRSKRRYVLITACVLALGAGEAGAQSGALDTSQLPRVAGAKQIFASPVTTIFTSPVSVAQTADVLGQALTAAGWQKDAARTVEAPNQRQLTLTKGSQALSVFITIAPAQNNATSVQYAALALQPTAAPAKSQSVAVTQVGKAMEPAPQIDVRTLPRLSGATDDHDSTPSSSRVGYRVAKPLDSTIAATIKMLAASGWTEYRRPSDEHSSKLKFFKKGPQGLTVSFYTPKQTESIVEFDSAWIYVDVPIPEGAADVVFDENRPYLKTVAPGSADTMLAFYKKELGAEGWVPLSAEQAKAQWPNASLDEKPYFIREKQKPIMVLLSGRAGGKVDVEVKVAPFALPQSLTAGTVYYGLPTPKPVKSAGGTNGDTEHKANALVIADMDAVLAFYRRELDKIGWKENSDGAAIKTDQATIRFTTPDGSAVLKLSRRYDLIEVSLVQKLPRPAAKPQLSGPATAADSLGDAMKEMQDMMRGIGGMGPNMAAQQMPVVPPAAQAAAQAMQASADSKAPVPMPDIAQDVEFDAGDGRLEFNCATMPGAVADFYRSAMKAQGWASRPSVISNANMVVLNFAKDGKTVTFTIMRMGSQTNVTAQGSALKLALAKSAVAHEAASADDLIAEDSNGLPVPKRHTMSESTKTPFRLELKATVPLNFKDVLGFYQRELGKLNWKEQGNGKTKNESAIIRYASPNGPAILNLERKDDAISVSLVVKNPDAADKAGVLPKPGQSLVLLGNINSAMETVMFDNKAYKVAPGAGTKGPDGPRIDLAPGKHKYSVKRPGRPAQTEELEIGEGDTWGLMVGPGGILPLQAY
jgi:hypothetical protein